MSSVSSSSLNGNIGNSDISTLIALYIHVNVNNLVDIETFELLESKRRLLSLFETTYFDWNSWQTSLLLPALRIYHFNEREINAHGSYCLYDSLPFSERIIAMGRISPRNELRCLIFIWKQLYAQQSHFSAFQILELKSQLRDKMDQLSLYDPIYSN
jgi:hypothetical protein